MAARTRLARTGILAIAVAMATALAAPAAAEPVGTLPGVGMLSALDSVSLSEIPLDAELAEALRMLKSNGADQVALSALTAILGAEGSPDLSALLNGGTSTPGTTAPGTAVPGTAVPETTVPSTDPAGTADNAAEGADAATPAQPAPALPEPTVAASPVTDPLTGASAGLGAFEKITGAKVLTPAFAPFCAATTDDNPLGLVTAPAVAVPGPFPKAPTGESIGQSLKGLLDSIGIPQLGDLLDQNQDLTEITEALSADQTAYALVPPAEHSDDKFQVAWFNTATLKGGMADLKPIKEVSGSPILQTLAGDLPVRLARVDTGQGSILTAVFGTTTHAGRTCYFLPAVGIVDTPAK